MCSLPYFCMSSKFFSIVISLNGNRRIRQTGPRSRPILICTALHNKSRGFFASQNTHSAKHIFGLKLKLLDCLVTWQLWRPTLTGHATLPPVFVGTKRIGYAPLVHPRMRASVATAVSRRQACRGGTPGMFALGVGERAGDWA